MERVEIDEPARWLWTLCLELAIRWAYRAGPGPHRAKDIVGPNRAGLI